MPKITAKVPYAGDDPATGEDFRLAEGDSRDVSQQKVDQLKRDFPDWFDFAQAKPARKRPPAEGKS